MNSFDGNAKVYNIHDVISFTQSIVNESTDKLRELMFDGVEFAKQKEKMQQTISELKEYKRALRKNIAKLMCENEIVKCDYEKQLKQKDSKIAYLNDSVTSLETLVSEKSIEIKTLKEELDSYEIISESSEDIMKDEGDDESDDEGDDEAEPFICNTRCIILNIVILYVYLYTIYWFTNLLPGADVSMLTFNDTSI